MDVKKWLMIVLAAILPMAGSLAQQAYTPAILILSPNKVTYPKIFEKEIAEANRQIKEHRKQIEKNVVPDEIGERTENFHMMRQYERDFIQTMDFNNQVSIRAEQFLAYTLYSALPNLLLAVKDIKSDSNLTSLHHIADTSGFRYVLNFPAIEYYQEDGISKAKISAQLYDHDTRTIWLQRHYVGDWYNNGFMFTCADSTLNCTINNALAPMLKDIIEVLAQNR